MTGGKNTELRLYWGRTSPSIRRVVASVLAIAVLLGLVPILAGVRTEFVPSGALARAGGVSPDEFAFALVSALASSAGLLAITGATILALVAAGRRFDAIFVGVAVLGASIVSHALKYGFHAPRPFSPESVAAASSSADTIVAGAVGAALVVAVGFALRKRRPGWAVAGLVAVLAALGLDVLSSRLLPLTAGFDAFPSSHALCSMALAAAVVTVAWRTYAARYPAVAVSGLYVLAVGLSRVYLRFHFPADVAAGWCVALAWTIGLRLLFSGLRLVDSYPIQPPPPHRMR